MYRKAFAADDVQLAQKLELQADKIHVPYARWRTAAISTRRQSRSG